jgi:hypothetical protein
MHPDQPSVNLIKEEFDESSDSGHASAVTPVLNDQNIYIPNGLNSNVFQPSSLKEFQQAAFFKF